MYLPESYNPINERVESCTCEECKGVFSPEDMDEINTLIVCEECFHEILSEDE